LKIRTKKTPKQSIPIIDTEEDKMSKVSVKNLIVFITGTNRERGIGRALVEEAIKRGG